MRVVLCPEDKTFTIDIETCQSLIQTTDLFSVPTIKCFIINPRMLHTLGYDINPDGEPVHGICYTCRLNRARTEQLFGVTSQTINLVVV
jgi:hypothetical protein